MSTNDLTHLKSYAFSEALKSNSKNIGFLYN